jgi:hypothetical protein
MEKEEEQKNIRLFYEGELEFLSKSREELGFLIKIDEIRRLHRLVSDMYYEIMSRNLPPELGFRRRGTRPHTDPVNAMLSFGYAMLFGNCMVACIGARLDPDGGLLHDGTNSLVYDLIDPLKPGTVHTAVFKIARETLREEDYELTPGRCILSDDLVREITRELHTSINADTLNRQVLGLADAIRKRHPRTNSYQLPAGEGHIGAILDAALGAQIVIVGTVAADHDAAQAELVRTLHARGQQPIVVALRTPYDLIAYPMIKTYLCAYGIRAVTTEAAARVLFGEIEALGTLPCPIPEHPFDQI